ncbi:MAG: aminotransferase class I/II-fold pyridoxal phosphate-dependent enzyme, partial [Pseudomonadota bacterium]
IAGPTALIAFLKMMAPGFVYSVGLSAPLAATAITALEVMQAEPERVARLQANGKLFRDCAREAGLDTGYSEGFAVTPVIVGDSLKAVALSHMLFEAGVNALPIVHPAVPEKAARVRFFLTSEHTEAQIRRTIEVTKTAVSEIEEIARQVFNPT